MARLVGVDLPREKRIEIALTYIFGVGRTRAQKALTETGISPDTRVKDLGDEYYVWGKHGIFKVDKSQVKNVGDAASAAAGRTSFIATTGWRRTGPLPVRQQQQLLSRHAPVVDRLEQPQAERRPPSFCPQDDRLPARPSCSHTQAAHFRSHVPGQQSARPLISRHQRMVGGFLSGQ